MIDRRTVQYFSIVRKSQVPCIIKCGSSALPFETFQTTEIRNIDSKIKKKQTSNLMWIIGKSR